MTIELKENNLHIRWLGQCKYEDVWALQQGLFSSNQNNEHKNYLLLVEHPAVYTFGVRGKKEHLLKSPAELKELGAEIFWSNRGGDVTFHGPGQLVGYPILSLQSERSGLVNTANYVHGLEDFLIHGLKDLGKELQSKITTDKKFPGLWIENKKENKKLASIGIKLDRGRTMHGFALNVSTDLSWFDHIIPCGIENISMTSLQEQRLNISVKEVADLVAQTAIRRWTKTNADITYEQYEKYERSVPEIETLKINSRKPEWLRAPVTYSDNQLKLKKILKDLPTVCEEAGCPNLSECWGAGTATFMINGERCTRNCGFCLVDTQKPLALDQTEPERLAKAVKNMGLSYVVITAVARDDLADGGAKAFVKTIRAIRRSCPEIRVEVLIPDFKGRQELLDLVFNERPDVLNHNLETVLRLQSKVRPQAGYARSLSVLTRAKKAGLTTKSSLMVGLGESLPELKAALSDLGQVGTDIVTIGQYLRPSHKHLPVVRWWKPEEFEELAKEDFNIPHIEAGPLVRSSYLAGNIHQTLETKEPIYC